MKKKLLSLLLAAMMLLAAAPTALAAVDNTGFSDVDAGIWYADAVRFVRERKLMNGTGGTSFTPMGTINRATAATILYHDAGDPATDAARFSDVPAGSWYSASSAWANETGYLPGYENGHFGGEDIISREELVSVLWRYTGSPKAQHTKDFADQGAISASAIQAVDWAVENGIVSGKDGNRFDPTGSTTRCELALILQHYITWREGQSADSSKALVVYYSATGSTRRVAGYIAGALNADTFELTPVNPYSDADLNWNSPSSRVNNEHNNTALRDIALLSTAPDNWDNYDTVFIGYPIWWGIAAWPVDNFVKSNDFTGKTVIPFCTSASSGLGQSGQLLAEMAGTGSWQTGQRFSSGVAEADVVKWIHGLN